MSEKQQTVALISIWESRPEKNTDYNGKILWANEEGNIDYQDKSLEQQVFYTKRESQQGNKYLKGTAMRKDNDGNLEADKDTALFPNESDNERAPALTGVLDGEQYRVALWVNDTTNPKAPAFRGKVQSKQ